MNHKATRVDNLMHKGCEPHWQCVHCGKAVPFHCYTKEEFESQSCSAKSVTMTEEHKRELREQMSMKAFTFMLDDVTKLLVIQKLKENGLDTKKGSISALIRVLLNYFTDIDPEDPTFMYIIQKVEEEYIFTTKKNKRSTM